MNNNKYMIYESAITPEITGIKKSTKGVEFITVLQEADVKNRNNRIYPKQVIQHALEAPLVKEHLRKKDWFGEVGHPFCTDLQRQTQIDLNNAAFRINEFWWEGNLLKGKCETLNNAKGRDMAALIEQGVLVSFSMRGQGNLIRDNSRDAMVVQDPLVLITFDWVAVPSHQDAYLESICEETKSSMFNTMSMSLNECCNLYDNGYMVSMNTITEEKPLKDYYTNYNKNFKSIAETYVYDKNDVIKEKTKTYFILESATELKKVAREDYLLQSIRAGIKESCAGIAPVDCPMSLTPLTDKDEVHPEVETKDVLQTLAHGNDVEDAKDYQNPVEATVKKELGNGSHDVSSGLAEETSVDEVEGVKLPEGVKNEEPKEESPEVETKDVLQTLESGTDIQAVKEEFFNYYNIISESAGTDNFEDIIKIGAKNTDIMSEECAYLFNSLIKEVK